MSWARKVKSMGDPKPEELGTDKEKETPEKTPAEPVKGSDEAEKLKKQLAESSAEGIRLAKERRKLQEERDKAVAETKEAKTELDNYKFSSEIPLDEGELSRKYPDWDNYDSLEKEKIKKIERLELSQARTAAELRKEKQDRIKKEEEDRFERNLTRVLANPEFSEDLKGRIDEFKEFCYQEENLGITNLDALAKSFLFDSVKSKKKDTETEEREGLESTTAGQKPTPPKEGMTLEEVDELRKSNPRKYNEMIRDGKLKIVE